MTPTLDCEAHVILETIKDIVACVDCQCIGPAVKNAGFRDEGIEMIDHAAGCS